MTPKDRSRSPLASGSCRLPGLSAVLLLASVAGCATPAASPGPRTPVYPGFDTQLYPGDETLRVWRDESPYEWIGFYLTSPCHRQATWEGTRERIERMGWGIAVLYVGQQAFEASDPPDPAGPIICSRTLLTEEQGRIDALDAAAKASAEGFPSGSVIYQNIESMNVIPDSMRTYYTAWQRALLQDGRYVPGTYAHHRNAVALHRLAQEVYRSEGRLETPPFWVAGGSGFSLDQPPWAIGLPFVRIWQGVLDVQRSWGGRALLIDENTATSASPSRVYREVR